MITLDKILNKKPFTYNRWARLSSSNWAQLDAFGLSGKVPIPCRLGMQGHNCCINTTTLLAYRIYNRFDYIELHNILKRNPDC